MDEPTSVKMFAAIMKEHLNCRLFTTKDKTPFANTCVFRNVSGTTCCRSLTVSRTWEESAGSCSAASCSPGESSSLFSSAASDPAAR